MLDRAGVRRSPRSFTSAEEVQRGHGGRGRGDAQGTPRDLAQDGLQATGADRRGAELRPGPNTESAASGPLAFRYDFLRNVRI